jgi:hypothetical protein
MNTRRSFFSDLTLLSALAAAASEAEGQSGNQHAAKQTQDFWDAYFEEAERTDYRTSRGDTPTALNQKKIVNFLQSTDNGLRFSGDIAPKELLSPQEKNVVVTVNPGHFRPSTGDHGLVSKSRGSQVRVDWFQNQPIMNLVAPMAWSGLAAWSPERVDKTTKKPIAAPLPPTLTDLYFRDPNAPNAKANNQVILMGGSGKLAVNVTAVRINERVDAALKATVDYSSIVAPYFGFAPLAIPALKAFTQLISYLYHRESVLMNATPVGIVATQDAKALPGPVNRVNLVSGSYLAVPDEHVDELKSAMPRLRIDQGWLVHQDADKNVKPADRSLDPRVPDITYISMDVKVEPLSDVESRQAKGSA